MARRQDAGGVHDPADIPPPTPRPKGTQPHQNSGGGSSQNGTDRVFQSSERGKPLPLAYGTGRVAPNIIERYDSVAVTNTIPYWTRDTDYFLSDARLSYGHTYQCVVEGRSAPTGALGQGPSGTGTDIVDGTVHWKYIEPGIYTAMALGFCEGQAYGVRMAWQDSFRYPDYNELAAISSHFALFLGTPAGVTRPSWFPVPGADTLPDYYSNTVVLFIDGTSGADASVPNVSLEIKALFTDATHVDASPADIAIDMLTHPRRGVHWPIARVDSVSTGGTDPASWRNYCTAYGLNLSWVIDTQSDVLTLLGLLLDATNSDAIQTNRPDGLGFMLKFVPRGDQALTANGVTFTPITTATQIGPDDLIEPVQIQRSPPIDRYNSCPIEYVDRDGDYVRTVVDDPDMADVELRGLRRATTFPLPQVIAPETAVMLSRIRAQRSLNVTRTFTLKLPDRFLLLEPTDLLTVSDPLMGLVNVPMRVTAVGEDIGADGSVTVTAEDWPGLVHAAAAYTPQMGDGYKPNQATPAARSPTLPSQVPPGTITDSANTRGGAYHNLFPNGTSEVNPPDGADTTTAEWVGRLQVADAWTGEWVREVASLQPAPPLLTAATPSTAGGTLPAGTRYYTATAITPSGETWISNEVSGTTTGSTSKVTVTWGTGDLPPGTTAIRIYVGTASGVYTSYFTVTPAAGTFTDTGIAGTAGTPPEYTDVYPLLGSAPPVLGFSGGPYLRPNGEGGSIDAQTSVTIPATPGCLFRVEAMARLLTGTSGAAAIDAEYLSATGQVLNSADAGTLSTTSATWTKLSGRGVTPPGTVAVRAVLRAIQSIAPAPATRAQFDAITLTQEFTERQMNEGAFVSTANITGTGGSGAWSQIAGMGISLNTALHVFSDTRDIRITAQISGYNPGAAGPISVRVHVVPGGASVVSFADFYTAIKTMSWNTVNQHQSWTFKWAIPAGTIPLGAIVNMFVEIASPVGSSAQFARDANDSYSFDVEIA